MKLHWVSREYAIKIILLCFGATILLLLLLFFLSRSFKTSALENDEMLALQQQALAREELLSEELKELEDKLSLATAENADLSLENQALNEATFSLLDSFELEYVGEFYATSYCAEEYPHICGGNGITASGTDPTPGITVASDWDVLPPGTWIYIEDVGLRRVEDSGSAILGNRLDVIVDTHENALRWPLQGDHDVWVLNMDNVEATVS